jgi:Archaeal TRASH domain
MLLQATKNKREESENNIKKGIAIQLQCDFCRGPISGKTHVFKFANFERFFCCTECRSASRKNIVVGWKPLWKDISYRSNRKRW